MLIKGSPDAIHPVGMGGVKDVENFHAEIGIGPFNQTVRPSSMDFFLLVYGRKPDFSLPPDDPNSDYALMSKINEALGDNIGANLDTRDWKQIINSSDPLGAAKRATAAMYSNPDYMAVNLANVAAQGYSVSDADNSYQQMVQRVGSTYSDAYLDTNLGKEVQAVIETGDSKAIKDYADELVSKSINTLKNQNSEAQNLIEKTVVKTDTSKNYVFTKPAGWETFTADQKIKYFNDHFITKEMLKSMGVSDSDIEWMVKHGYTGEPAMAVSKTEVTTGTQSKVVPLLLATAAAYFLGA